MDTLQSDLRLSRALQEHAVRVMQVVEKVIGRLQNLEKVKLIKLRRTENLTVCTVFETINRC